MREIIDIKLNGKKVYVNNHAKATYMSDGRTVEDAINNIEVGTGADLSDYATKEELNDKQDTLVSGTNIKTINGKSILGEGNLIIKESSSDANVLAVDTSDVLDDVETNTYVKYVSQTLTEEQKSQVRSNIGVGENVSQEYVDNAIANAITNTLNTAV